MVDSQSTISVYTDINLAKYLFYRNIDYCRFSMMEWNLAVRLFNYLVKYLLWRPLGVLTFGHPFAFEDMPFLQALSMLGYTLSFTHWRKLYPLTRVYDWRHFCKKQDPTVRLGVIGGTAQSVTTFMMSVKKSPHAEVTAVASRTWETGKACAQKYDIPKVYSPYELLLADSMIDGIVVFSPISTHEKLIEKILDSGKHCFMVPPMTANATELKRIWQYHSENHPNLLCVCIYSSLSHPINHKMRDMIRDGAIGKVQQIFVRANWPAHAFDQNSIQFNYDTAGGAWEDLGPQAITMVRFMLGGTQFDDSTPSFKIISATATLPPFASNVDETMNATFLYGDVHIDIEVSLVKSMDISIEIKGTKGTLQQTQWFKPEMFNELAYRKADGTATFYEHRGKGEESGKASCGYAIDNIVHSILTGETLNLGTFEEELCTIEIVDEVYRKCGLGVRCPISFH